MRTHIAILTLLMLLPVGCAGTLGEAHEELVLVQDGQPKAVIVLADEASDDATTAANELQHYLAKISGATLPIGRASEPVAAGVGRIHVGKSRMTDRIAGLEIPTGRTHRLGEDGFVIHCDGRQLVLAGNDTGGYTGNQYAVYDFLHRLGVRWFMPGDFGEVVPTQASITVKPISVVDMPDFAVRMFWTHSLPSYPPMSEERRRWMLRNKMTADINRGGTAWYQMPSDSSVRGLLTAEMFEKHPEWFALEIDGKRNPHMPNMGNEELIAAISDAIKVRAAAGEKITAFSADDGMPQCRDPLTLAHATDFPNAGKDKGNLDIDRSISEQWMFFVRRIAETVHEEYPDHVICTNGYANRVLPPERNRIADPDRLMIMFAHIEGCTIHGYDDACWQMDRQLKMLKRWCELSNKVFWYNYNYCMLISKNTISPMVSRLRQNFPHWKEAGTWGFSDQDEVDWSTTGITTRYVRGRLYWDANADVDWILDDYFDKWFGPSGPALQEYYDLLEHAFSSANVHGHEDTVLPIIYSDELMAKLGPLMDEAIAKATDEPFRTRVELERQIYLSLWHYVESERAKRICDFASAVEHLEAIETARKAMHKITPFMGVRPYPVCDHNWEANRMRGIHGLVSGEKGKRVTVMPEVARFRTDPFDDGRYDRWQDADHDDSDWRTIRTTAGWEPQGEMLTEDGQPYLGLAWYRFDVDVPALPEGQKVHLFGPAVISSAWVWVNGEYVGRRKWMNCWYRPQHMDIDVTPGLKPGQRNQITIRVRAESEAWGSNGIYERMFLYTPHAEQVAQSDDAP